MSAIKKAQKQIRSAVSWPSDVFFGIVIIVQIQPPNWWWVLFSFFTGHKGAVKFFFWFFLGWFLDDYEALGRIRKAFPVVFFRHNWPCFFFRHFLWSFLGHYKSFYFFLLDIFYWFSSGVSCALKAFIFPMLIFGRYGA